MKPADSDACCPRFDPQPWDGKEVHWQNKRFVKARVRSCFHIPLNFGAVVTRCMGMIEAAGAGAERAVILSDENSLWGADVYIEVAKDVPGASMAGISGTFLCKAFEGPYHNMRKWIGEMKAFVQNKGYTLQKQYVFYTTCPRCAKKYGENYVVILARV